jgi:hypothetical protein
VYFGRSVHSITESLNGRVAFAGNAKPPRELAATPAIPEAAHRANRRRVTLIASLSSRHSHRVTLMLSGFMVFSYPREPSSS